MDFVRLLSRGIFGLILAFALVTGCKEPEKQVDPLRKALTGYKNAVEPPLQKSEEIAQLFVQVVLDDKGTPDPDKAAQRVQAEVLPRARDFLEQVRSITPKEPTLVELHQYLVQAATLRLEGYQQIVDGYTQKNLTAFTEGQKKVTDSKIQEDEYIARADQLMRSQGLELVYFAPQAAAAP